MYNSAIGRAVIDQRLARGLHAKTIREQTVKDCIQKPCDTQCANLNTSVVIKNNNLSKLEDFNKSEHSENRNDTNINTIFKEAECGVENLASESQDEEIRSDFDSGSDDCDDNDIEIGSNGSVASVQSSEMARRDSNNNRVGHRRGKVDNKPLEYVEPERIQELKLKYDNITNSRIGKRAGLRSGKKNVNIIESVEHSKNNRNKRGVDENDERVIKTDRPSPFVTQLAGKSEDQQTIRAKTSTSKRSTVTQKTTKSCPAKMDEKQKQVQLKHNTVKAVPTLRARTASSKTRNQVKLFSQMSQEAQHALSETMKEKSIPETEVERPYRPVPVSTSVWEIERPTIEEKLKTGKSNKTPCENVKPEEEVRESRCEIEDIIQDDAYSDTDVSIPTTRRRPISTKVNRTRLPYIPSESPTDYFTLGQLKHLNYRLPGIGKYEIATLREKTFQITPAGYDIRYNDIAIFEAEEKTELPSSNIRDQAVQKCQDWLSRYTPRFNNASSTKDLKDIV